MAEHTNIKWTDSVHNFWRGCTKVSPGCLHCFAEALVTTRLKGQWGKGAPRVRAKDFNAPLRWNKKPCVCEKCGEAYTGDFLKEHHLCGPYHRRRVFSLSLGDWLDPEVPVEWLADMLDVVRRCEALDFLLLTKRPELWMKRMLQVLNGVNSQNGYGCVRTWIDAWLNGQYPSNVWLGVSVEDQARADERVPLLLKMPAKVRFLSVEPLLEPVDLRLTHGVGLTQDANTVRGEDISWCIVGGESGPRRRDCGVEAIEDVLRQCKAAGVPAFCKQDCAARPGQRGRLSDEAWATKQFPDTTRKETCTTR